MQFAQWYSHRHVGTWSQCLESGQIKRLSDRERAVPGRDESRQLRGRDREGGREGGREEVELSAEELSHRTAAGKKSDIWPRDVQVASSSFLLPFPYG